MAELNMGWGAPRIPAELLELGIEVSEIAVSRYMPKRPRRAGSWQRWTTFMRNHLHETLAIDFAVVPTATFGILYGFFVLSLERRRVLLLGRTGWLDVMVCIHQHGRCSRRALHLAVYRRMCPLDLEETNPGHT